jgi:hypothetical protein
MPLDARWVSTGGPPVRYELPIFVAHAHNEAKLQPVAMARAVAKPYKLA